MRNPFSRRQGGAQDDPQRNPQPSPPPGQGNQPEAKHRVRAWWQSMVAENNAHREQRRMRKDERRELRAQARQNHQQTAPAGPAPVTSPPQGPQVHAPGRTNTETLDLVNYTPEQLMQQVQSTLSGVSLDMPATMKIKWVVGQLWSVLGPVCLFLGTAGEVYFFILNNSTGTDQWWVALSVLITVIVLEFTFMVVSYQSDAIRNDMKSKPGGATLEDKADMHKHMVFWFLLAAGVSVGQVSFLVLAMQTKLGGDLPFVVAFSCGRSFFTLAGDFYSAFVHREMPSSGDRAERRLKRESDLTATLLKRKAEQVQIINSGTITLREQHTEAVMRDEAARTELEMKRLENQARLNAKKTMDEQAQLFTNLGAGMMRALFDPGMPDDERAKLLLVMQGFMGAAKYLPASVQVTTVDPNDPGAAGGGTL